MDVVAWFLSANIMATFVCKLKPKQPPPQPSPTVAGEGAYLGKHQASRLKLVPFGLAQRNPPYEDGYITRVASTGERRDARHAGTITADWPSNTNATTPAIT